MGSEKAVATAVGKNQTFTIQIEGTKAGGFKPIGRSPAVTVNPQAKGKGTAIASVTADADGSTDLYAGEESRQIVVVYKATGQMSAAQVKLTLPAVANGWSAASADHVTVTPSAGTLVPMYGAGETPATQDVTVTGVNLPPNGIVTFVYTGSIGAKKADNVAFGVMTTGEITAAVTAVTAAHFAAVPGDEAGNDATVDVGYAKRVPVRLPWICKSLPQVLLRVQLLRLP